MYGTNMKREIILDAPKPKISEKTEEQARKYPLKKNTSEVLTLLFCLDFM